MLAVVGLGAGRLLWDVWAQLTVHYDGPSKSTPGDYCAGTGRLVEGRGTRHLRVGGVAIDAAAAEAFLAALEPSALQARPTVVSVAARCEYADMSSTSGTAG